MTNIASIGMKTLAAGIALSGLLVSQAAQAVIHTEDPDPAYEALSQSAFCMNHFYYRTSSYLGHQAGFAAQTALASQMEELHDGAKVSDAIRMAFNAIDRSKNDETVPFACRQFIPQDHGMSDSQLKYFLSHSADQPK
ncbi:hypothetical protein A264_19132 [Pseudomonas syringae pv. actinidiae ICMP 19071]|uniref:hypothetical protein n=1 Tax=Pseudomonas syringae TaxID=317 RepID=UPI0003573D9D|nr:hypothetical protein [Pseudomonas syringae]EPM57801.1 hypothetical protein A264_19132 [Pseudomonas syringae pv. actinidiae ICMP 19071]EPM60343.1 hypothetical protein A262_08314 [Pseudomonas syringae pv. actinidiae ICMP 19073]EPM76282.1 hypothetical protein A3SO_18578 [Pseudomonas syringae pv. actinidiae ICMP 19072]OSN67172.1 hypothetical protein BV349_01976 [Pseudomonas syringae pv. actinidiae]OSN77773.1 hypothetical protein BV351_01796 [Pseudomonas syringae pv. actinidiae]